jgi:hypothetical protein
MIKFVIALSLFSFSALANINMTVDDVLDAQKDWGDGIVKIGKVYLDGGDYRQAALDHILNSYDYQDGVVLFKPTLAAKIPFRPTVKGALSYFVGGDEDFAEDSGFAIKPWTKVRFENHNIIVYGIKGIAMGHYYFTNLQGDEIKVEYTLGFIKRGQDVKITIQDSSIPYSP